MAKKANLRFTNKNSLPHEYQRKFLDYVHELAPEVEETLKELVPTYRAVIRKCSRKGILRDWIMHFGSDGFSDDDHPAYTKLDRGIKNAILERAEPPGKSTAGKRAFESFLELRNGFEHFLEHFGLTTHWLKDEYLMRLRILSKESTGPNDFAYLSAHVSVLGIGNPIKLEIKGWNVNEGSLDFEARAKRQFELALAENKEATIKHFRALGYKRTTKPHDLTIVKWLVLWTVKRMAKDKILNRISKLRPSTMIEDELNDSFRKLQKKYDLPFRRVRRGESMPEKG